MPSNDARKFSETKQKKFFFKSIDFSSARTTEDIHFL